MNHLAAHQPTPSGAPPLLAFPTLPARLPQPASVVQKLCADYERFHAAFVAACKAYCDAQAAAIEARPKPHVLIRPTTRNLADVPDYTMSNKDRGRFKRCPLSSGEIQREINYWRKNTCKIEGVAPNCTIYNSEKGFPLTAKQKARLKRIEARLPIALAHEAECAAIEKRLRVKELDKAQWIPGDKLRSLGDRIAKTASKDRQDMLAKAHVCEIDPEADEVHEISASIASDFVRLAAAGAV